jgi:putative ABC transport system ATP-binding protein
VGDHSQGLPVVVDSVTKRYTLGDGSVLLAADNATLSVAAGECVALTGTSGSGKSTLLHLVGAVERPDAGTITVGGAAVSALKGRAAADYRATIGFVFQQFHLIPSLTALDNVFAPLVGRTKSKAGLTRAHDLLDGVGLAGRSDAYPAELSGGQQQRVAIARALVVNPGVLLADEPTGSLDSGHASEIMELLERLQAELGVTMLVATHDPNLARWCDRRVMISDGRLTEAPANPAAEEHLPRRLVDAGSP